MNAAAGKIYTRYNEIWLDAEGILWVRATEVTEIDLDEVKACFEVYKQLGCDQKRALQLLDVRNSITMTKEARDYVASEGVHYFRASAVVSSALSVRLVVNFFNFFYKHKVPFKMFGSERDALRWLHKIKK